ncbi:hypothetical protein N9917_01850 [Deltaproteobacteria bacterium]|nr:hypothetical protein [Deltaproteobacteria bacterium]
MSNLSAIGMISAISIAALFVQVRADKHIHDRGDDILTGTVRGIPTSQKNRWVMLFQHWMPNVAGQILFGFILAVAYVGIARNVDDGFVQLLAYLCAIGAGYVVVFWSLLGPWYFFYLASLLRQAEAD